MAFSSKQVLSDTLDWTLVEKGKAVRACLEQAKLEKRRRLNWGGGEEVAAEKQRCPRCNSADTKFCYYNNYNKSQPRHLCKACKRHWTVGGTLRDVPVGGACKSKRSRSAKTASNNTTEPPPTSTPFPPMFFTEVNHGADDDHLYDDALDVCDETFPFGLGLADVGCSSSTSGEHRHEQAMAGSDSSWSSDLLPVGFLESSSWNWEDLVQCLSTDQQPALLR